MRDYLAQRAKVNERRGFFLLWYSVNDYPAPLSSGPRTVSQLPPTSEEVDEKHDDHTRRSR